MPLIDKPTSDLLSHGISFNNFLVEWDEIRKEYYDNEITDKELEDWRLSHPKISIFLRRYK